MNHERNHEMNHEARAQPREAARRKESAHQHTSTRTCTVLYVRSTRKHTQVHVRRRECASLDLEVKSGRSRWSRWSRCLCRKAQQGATKTERKAGEEAMLSPFPCYMCASVGMHRRTRGILFNKTPPQASLITALTSSLTSALA